MTKHTCQKALHMPKVLTDQWETKVADLGQRWLATINLDYNQTRHFIHLSSTEGEPGKHPTCTFVEFIGNLILLHW